MTGRGVLLGLAGGLAVLAVIEGVMPAGRPAATVMRAPPITPASVGAAPADPDRLIATIVARPLLRPDRRPVALPGVAPTGDALPRLSGILVGHGVKLAMFADRAGKTLTRAEGGMIGRYRVVRIAAGAVTLGAGAARIVLTPRFAGIDGRIAAPVAIAPIRLETPGRS